MKSKEKEKEGYRTMAEKIPRERLDLFLRSIMNQIEYVQKKGLFSGDIITKNISYLFGLTGVYLFILAQFYKLVKEDYLAEDYSIYFFLLSINIFCLIISYAVNKVFRREWIMTRFCRMQEKQLIRAIIDPLPEDETTKKIVNILDRRLLTIHNDDNPKYREGTKRFLLTMTSCIFSFYVVNGLFLLYIILNSQDLLARIAPIVTYVLALILFIFLAVVTYWVVKPPLLDSSIEMGNNLDRKEKVNHSKTT